MGQIPSHAFPIVWTWNRWDRSHPFPLLGHRTGLKQLTAPCECHSDAAQMGQTCKHPQFPKTSPRTLGSVWCHHLGWKWSNPTELALGQHLMQAALHSLFQAVPIAAGWQGMARSHSSPWNALGHSLSSSLSYSKTTWTEGTGTAQFHFYPQHCCLCCHLSHRFTELMNNETSSNLHNHLQCLQDKHTSCPNWLSCL